MALTTERTVALTILLTLILSSCQGESITLWLQQDQHSVCFDQPVWLTCQYPNVSSGMFRATKPSWKEDGDVFSIDNGMYRSVRPSSETVQALVLELVPEQSHFQPSGVHNYSCFLPLVRGGDLESNPVPISPIKELPAPVLHVVEVNETSVKLEWSHSGACFEDCDITFNLTWTPSQEGQSESVETNDTMHCITSLKRDEVYEATLTALCREQSQATMVSRTVVVAFNTFPDPIYDQTESPSPMASPTPHNNSEIETASPSHIHLDSPWPEIIGGSIGFAFLFVAMVILIMLLSICAIMLRRRKLKSESSQKHNEKGDSDVPVHVYDTVSYAAQLQEVQFQANPSYNPIMQSLQAPAASVSMQANPSYTTISDVTGL